MIAILTLLFCWGWPPLAMLWIAVVGMTVGGMNVLDALVVCAPIEEGRDVARRIGPVTPPPQIPPPAAFDFDERLGICRCGYCDPPSELERRVSDRHPGLLPPRPPSTHSPGPGERVRQ